MNEKKNEGLKSFAILAPAFVIPAAAWVTALTMGLGGLAVAGIAIAGVLGGAAVSVGVGNTIAKIDKVNEKKAIEQNIDKDKNNTKEKSKEKELGKEKTNEIDKEKNMGLKSLAILAPAILIPLAALVTALTMGLGGVAVAGITTAGVLAGVTASVGVGNTIAKMDRANEAKQMKNEINTEKNEIEKTNVIEKEKTYQMGKEQELSNPYPEQKKEADFVKMPGVPVPYDVEHGMHNNELNTKTPPAFLKLSDSKMDLKTEAPRQNPINRPSNPIPENEFKNRSTKTKSN